MQFYEVSIATDVESFGLPIHTGGHNNAWKHVFGVSIQATAQLLIRKGNISHLKRHL